MAQPVTPKKPPRIYPEVPFLPFLLATVVVGAPILILQNERPDWVGKYVFLIMLSLVVFYRKGFANFSDFVTGYTNLLPVIKN